jgi:hypothetical protein
MSDQFLSGNSARTWLQPPKLIIPPDSTSYAGYQQVLKDNLKIDVKGAGFEVLILKM